MFEFIHRLFGCVFFFFFFSSRRRHTRFSRDWSSDVCSSDLSNLGFWGLVGSEAAMAPFATLPAGTTILAKTVQGADAKSVARQIEREVFNQGADTTTVSEIYDSAAAGTQAFIDFMRLVMGIG